MAIACVQVPNLTLRIEVQQRPELDGTPLILRADGSRALVADVSPEASVAGVRPGMSLREASALCPEAVVVESNPVRDEAHFARIVDRLEQLSPLVEPDGLGLCYIDLAGLDRQLGDAATAAGRLLQAVPAVLRPRVGVGPGKFVARLAARQAAPGGTLVVTGDEAKRFLAGQPVDQLPLPVEVIRQLERLGLHTLGALAALPRSAVEARFGTEGGRAWLLARGVDEQPLRPRPREERVVEQLTLPAPATNREMLMVALRQVVSRAFGRPALRRRQVRQVRVLGAIEGGRSWEHSLTLREPADGPRLLEALDHRLQALTLPGPLEALTLELSGLTVESGYQGMLLDARAERAGRLAKATDYLRQRYGSSPLMQIVRVEPWSRIPERRYALISYEP
jgi:DNA polymerase-4/protein ImuB